MLNFSNIYHWRVIHTSSIISSFTLHLRLSFKIIHLACKLSANPFPLTSFYNFLFSSSTVALNISTSFHCQFRISDYMCFVFLNSSNFLFLCARALSLLYCRFLKLVRLFALHLSRENGSSLLLRSGGIRPAAASSHEFACQGKGAVFAKLVHFSPNFYLT